MAIRVTPPQNKTYYINPANLTFTDDSGYGANLIQVSASSSCYISVYDPSNSIGYSDADRNYRKWKLTAYNNRFPDNDAFHIYARLPRDGGTALVVYDKVLRNVDGSIAGDESSAANESHYFIRIGEVSATDGMSIREITYDTGYLESDQGAADSGGAINDMWELDRYSTPWLIRAKHWLSSFTLKGFLTFVGGVIFKNGDEEKVVTDIKRSSDSDVPVSDDTLPTTRCVQEMGDARYLSKIQPDETPHHVGLLGGLTTTEASSDDYSKGTIKGGWTARKNDEGEWYMEADILMARILANVYDLLVENNAVFKGSLSSEEFVSGFLSGKGWAIRMKEFINSAGVSESKSVAEFDDLIVRGSMRVYEFIVSQLLGENDNRIFTGMMEVDHYDAESGRIYLSTDGGRLYNPFRVDDIIIVQQYGGNPSQDNGYYVVKQYEFIVTEAGVGEAGDGRLDWVTFRNFTTSVEGGDESLIAERDTLVRIDNLSDASRKGVIQLMSVGEDTPYMDFVYGAKTDPDNALKGRLGNLGGVYNPLFGWLKDFGAYLTNLYAVGEFVIAHTGENVADSIEIAKGVFRTNYRQTTFDMTEEQDFLTNASFTDNCSGWILGEDTMTYFLVGDVPQYFNHDLYSTSKSFAGLAELNGRDMLRLYGSTARQENSLIDKPGTHKVYGQAVENEDGSFTDNVTEETDKLYLNVRFFCRAQGSFEFGFADSDGSFHDDDFHYSLECEAGEDAYMVSLSGTWDGEGDFLMSAGGDIYIDLLSLTDKPLENYMITTSTAIEQDAERISLLGRKVNGVEGSVSELGIELNASEERIMLWATKQMEDLEGSVMTDVGQQISASEASIKTWAKQTIEGYGYATQTYVGQEIDAVNGTISNVASRVSTIEGSYATQTYVGQKISASEGSIKTWVTQTVEGYGYATSSFVEQTATSITNRVTAIEGDYVKSGELSVYVKKNSDGTLESGVKITADNVDINNGVLVIDSTSAKVSGRLDVGDEFYIQGKSDESQGIYYNASDTSEDSYGVLRFMPRNFSVVPRDTLTRGNDVRRNVFLYLDRSRYNSYDRVFYAKGISEFNGRVAVSSINAIDATVEPFKPALFVEGGIGLNGGFHCEPRSISGSATILSDIGFDFITNITGENSVIDIQAFRDVTGNAGAVLIIVNDTSYSWTMVCPTNGFVCAGVRHYSYDFGGRSVVLVFKTVSGDVIVGTLN